MSAFCRPQWRAKQPPTWRSTGRHSEERRKVEGEALVELEADAVAVAIQIWRKSQILSGTVSVVGDLFEIESWRIQDWIHSWGLVGTGSWRIRDCPSLSRCRRSLERCCPQLACVHAHHDHDGDDDDGEIASQQTSKRI